MIHAPSGIAQAQANVRVCGWTALDPRPSKSSKANDVRWALGRHWAIEPHWPWRAVTSTLPVRAAAHTRSSLCLVFDGHRGFVLFGAVTCACIERASGVRGLWLGARTEPVVLCGTASAAQYGKNVMIRRLFLVLWRWRRCMGEIERQGVQGVAYSKQP
jgi:hypothetical protein